jgi:hypothetical protein
MDQSLSSQVSRKSFKFGLWIKCFLFFHHQELVLTLNMKSKKKFCRLEIQGNILISIPSNKSLKILKIKDPQNKFRIYLKFPSKKDSFLWFTALND